MKLTRRLFLLLGAALLWTACQSSDTTDDEDDSGLPKPEISVYGAPSVAVKPWTSFVLTVDSPSNAVLSFSVDKPEVATVTLKGRRMYNVAVSAPAKETTVTITFSQEAGAGYDAAEASVSFTVLKREAETHPDDPNEDLAGVKVSFTESNEPVLNPERGFYGGASDIRSASSPVSYSAARAVRTSGMSLMYVGFYLTDFMSGDISDAYLNMIRTSLDNIRQAGIKVVLRFAYQNNEDSKPWDAPVDVVLRHVEQLKPILQDNADVIFILQAGFVGVWGEWYYTSHFNMNPSKDADYEPRLRLTRALLDALPASRQIALRTPQFKMRMFKLSQKDTLTYDTAHDGSDLSRLAGHNDCFGASAEDYGTFDNESGDRAFWKGDSRYTIMGGETCKVSDYCTCTASLKDMADYHWTYLNSGYHGSVLTRWKNTGCYDTILDCLGYRLVMKDVYYSENPSKGKPMKLTLRFCNRGFAAPMNPRNSEIIFVAADGAETRFALPSDPRTWHPGWYVVETEITLPADKGRFYLALEDPLLPGRPEYSIALANEGVFDSKTGWNKLFELN